MKIKVLIAIFLMSSIAQAKGISCSIKKYEASKKELQITCPPEEVFSPLRVDLFLLGEIDSPRERTLCKFDADTEKHELSLEYRDAGGKKRWTRLDRLLRQVFKEQEIH